MSGIVKAKLVIRGGKRRGKRAIMRNIQIKDYTTSDFLSTIQVGDLIKIKGLMKLRISSIKTFPMMDAFGNMTLSEAIFYCSVGES